MKKIFATIFAILLAICSFAQEHLTFKGVPIDGTLNSYVATDCVEEFQGYSQPTTDSEKMYKVQFDNCKYGSIFTTQKGEIQLSIGHDGVSSCFVKLLYIDKINNNSVRQDALDDL